LEYVKRTTHVDSSISYRLQDRHKTRLPKINFEMIIREIKRRLGDDPKIDKYFELIGMLLRYEDRITAEDAHAFLMENFFTED
jgi:hypothetical protein